MSTHLYTTNMVLFDEKYKLKKYKSVDQIIDEFCKVRFANYTKRKAHQIENLKSQLKHIENKMKFVNAVVTKKLLIMNRPESEINADIELLGVDKQDGGYDYLLRLQVRTFTTEKVVDMEKEIETMTTSLKILKGTSETKMWLRELAEFEKHYNKFLVVMEKTDSKKKK